MIRIGMKNGKNIIGIVCKMEYKEKCDKWELFWMMFWQKILRNLASMKFQWLLLLYIPVIYGMFKTPQVITSEQGLIFLGGGFVTLATSRILARTKLTESPEDGMDTEK